VKEQSHIREGVEEYQRIERGFRRLPGVLGWFGRRSARDLRAKRKPPPEQGQGLDGCGGIHGLTRQTVQ
jgi:hypothetical protein